MTVRELITQLISNHKINWDEEVWAYDPTADDYRVVTGIAVRPDGGVEMQTPD